MFQTSLQGALLVDAEVKPGRVSQQRDDLRELAGCGSRGRLRRVRGSRPHSAKLRKNEFGNFSDRRDEIDGAGRDRAARHAIEFGFLGILSDHETAFFLDRKSPNAAIRTGARQDDADGLLAASLRERIQEEVEGQSRAALLRRFR